MDKKTFLELFNIGLLANGFSSEEAEAFTMAASYNVSDESDYNTTDVEKLILCVCEDRGHGIDTFFGINQNDDIISEDYNEQSFDEQIDFDEYEDIVEEINPDEEIISEEDDVPYNNEPADPVLPEKEKIKASPLFIAIFIVTLPIWAILFSLSGVLIGAIYVFVSLLVAAICCCLLVTVGGGSALSLADIIYGATECGTKLPLGLYDIGIGIELIGSTLLLSILLYNLAIRLIPKLYPLVRKFAKLIFGGIVTLFLNIKKGCASK